MVADSVIAFVLNLLEERPDETCPRWHLSRQALTKRKRVIWMRYCATVLKAKFLQCYLIRQIGFWWTCSRENILLSRRQMKHYLETGIARDAVRSRTILLAYLPVLILLFANDGKVNRHPPACFASSSHRWLSSSRLPADDNPSCNRFQKDIFYFGIWQEGESPAFKSNDNARAVTHVSKVWNLRSTMFPTTWFLTQVSTDPQMPLEFLCSKV